MIAASKNPDLIKPEMKPDAVFHANKSMTGGTTNNIAFPLSYGSANLEGFKYTDTVCLNPLAFNSRVQISKKDLKKNFCIPGFKF
tara:strand:- start:244 stop:498 length:255 start_codon:yes stop_codon:yes gene_type:complete